VKVAVIGAGSWGTALAQVLGESGAQVCMWARKQEVADAITNEHRNPRYLSDSVLHEAIVASTSMQQVLEGAQAVVVVTPSSMLREFAEQMKPYLAADTPIVIASKGVEEGTALLPMDIFEQVVGNLDRLAVLSGPTHAEEVIKRIPSGAVVASPSLETREFFAGLFTTPRFRLYISEDYVGVEICAAYKNVIAIAVGIAYGMGLGDNTAAMVITRGMAEMSRLVEACGANPLTVMGLAGAGDLVVTCTSRHSRNSTFGRELAQGTTLDEYVERTHMVVEGAVACKTILPLGQRYGVELPLCQMVEAVVWEGTDSAQAALELINRPQTTEFWGLDLATPSA